MTATDTAESTWVRRRSRGSALSDRQLAFAVRDGRLVTAALSSGEHIEGYIIGSDDYHWALVTKSGQVVLVHKSIPALTISSASSLAEQNADVQSLTSAFRGFIMETYFSSDPSSRQPKKA